MKHLIATILFSKVSLVFAGDTLSISPDIYLFKLSENAFIHVSWHNSPEFGRFTSNGLVFINDNQAFLFDTPMSDELTNLLISFLEDSMKLKLTGFVPNHFHPDCTEGLDLLNEKKIPSYSNHITYKILKERNLPVTRKYFEKSITLKLGNKEIVCDYPGPGHSVDNIVVWIPSEKILFGGCMIKSLGSKSLGNIADADLTQWPATIENIVEKYSDVEIVIPGHGNFGNKKLLYHTINLLKKK